MMRACVLVCPPKQTACTQTALCIQGYQWDSKSCSCVPAAPAPGNCTVDADCSATADYCTGCDCRALGTGQSLPACSGPGVRCFADPCMGKVAACVNNTCVIQ